MTKSGLPIIDEGNFQKSIGEAIQAKRHVSFLKQVLIDYEEYKRVFSEIFLSQNLSRTIYVFRFNYLDKHPVWRDIAILSNHTFGDLADTLVESMDWDNDHMHGFSPKKFDGKTLGRYTPFSIYSSGWEDDPHPTFKTNQVKIAHIDFQKYPKWNFVFDFGAGHEFDVELRSINYKSVGKELDKSLPTCINQRGVAPLQYPEYDGPDKWEYDDNCPHCRELKESGTELVWHPDEHEKLKN